MQSIAIDFKYQLLVHDLRTTTLSFLILGWLRMDQLVIKVMCLLGSLVLTDMQLLNTWQLVSRPLGSVRSGFSGG